MSESGVIHLRPRQRRKAERVLLTTAQAAERLSVSQRTMERWLARGMVPHVRPDPESNIVRIPVDALDEWWRRRQEGGQ